MIRKVKASKNSHAQRHVLGNPYPTTHFVNNEQFCARYQNFVLVVTIGKKPKNFKETIKET